jgi:hypothetical protein
VDGAMVVECGEGEMVEDVKRANPVVLKRVIRVWNEYQIVSDSEKFKKFWCCMLISGLVIVKA